MLLDPVFLARNRFQAVAHTQVGLHQPVHLGHVAPGGRAQGGEQAHHVVAGEVVVGVLGLAAGLDQTGVAQVLQVLGGVGHGQARDCGQGLDATRILGDKFQQFQAIAMRLGIGDAG